MGVGLAVTREEIRRLAALAELALDDERAAELERQVGRILDYVRQLQEADLSGPGVADGRVARLREDVVAPDPLAWRPEEFAPAMQDGLFLVPRLGALAGGEEAP